MDSIRRIGPIFLQGKGMKDLKSMVVLASLFLLFLSAGAFGGQEIAINAGTILPISNAPIENGTILIKKTAKSPHSGRTSPSVRTLR